MASLLGSAGSELIGSDPEECEEPQKKRRKQRRGAVETNSFRGCRRRCSSPSISTDVSALVLMDAFLRRRRRR